jgi:hypothetical protein
LSDPFERAAASAPPTLGEGCLRRFDPEHTGEEQGAEFAGAAALWAEWLQAAESAVGHRSRDGVPPPALD